MKEKSGKHRGCLWWLFVRLPLWFIAVTLAWVLVLKWMPVYFTPLEIVRGIEHIGDSSYNTHKTWRSLNKISHNLPMAVMSGEDSRFLSHSGFDFVEIDKAMEASKKGKKLRGASTISQQTAKNVFLLPGRSWLRKGLEAYFTVLIEAIWGKERIMEVYVNVAEMGPGIFGAEAAAQNLFGVSADRLTSRQSALIAATLPNPYRMRADRPSNYVNKRAAAIQSLMGKIARPVWLGGTYSKAAERSDKEIRKSNKRAFKKIREKVSNKTEKR